MNFDQQALVDLFRQSFSPLVQLGQGRLAIAQAAAERDYAAREQAARREQAMRDHVTGIMLQNQLLGEREMALEGTRTKNAVALEEARRETAAQVAAAQTGAGMYWNVKASREARDAKEIAELKDTVAGLGVDPTPLGDDPAALRTARAKALGNYRGAATEIYRDQEKTLQAIADLDTKMQVPEEEQMKIAKRIVASAAADDKALAAKVNKAATLEDVLALADDHSLRSVQTAIETKEKSLLRRYGPQAQVLRTRLQGVDRRLQVLEARGIVPDYAALRGSGAAPLSESESEGESGDDLGLADIFPMRPAAAEADESSRALETGAALGLTGAGATSAGRGAVRAAPSAMRYLASGAQGFAPAAAKTLLRGVAGPVGLASLANDAPTFFGGEPISASLAGLALSATGQDPTGEVERQRAQLAMIDGLIKRASGGGDIETARRLRAAKYAPAIDEDAILRAIVQKPGESFRLPNGRGMSRR